MKARIITIGDEILIGQVIDTNSAWLGEELFKIGISVRQIVSIKDEKNEIIKAIKAGFNSDDLILITGGLGPTKDDITKKTLVSYFDDELYFDEASYNKIQRFFRKIGKTPLPAHKEQCYMPKKAKLLSNRMGTAPGMLFNHLGKTLISMPGVPYEMKAIMTDHVLDHLRSIKKGDILINETIRTVGAGESMIANQIEEIIDDFPDHFTIAFLPSLGSVRLRITAKGKDKEKLKKELDSFVDRIEQKIPHLVYGRNKTTLAEAVGKILMNNKLKIATAESCTAGYISNRLSTIPGASDYLKGSIVAYSYDLKESLLGVKNKTLKIYGAVSEETVKEMAKGVIKCCNVDIGLSISGILGPGGGTRDKPVGTVYLCVSNKEHTKVVRIQAGKDRMKNMEYAAICGLNLIRKFVSKHYPLISK